MQTIFNFLLIGNFILFFILFVLVFRGIKMFGIVKKAEDSGYMGCCLDVLKVMSESIMEAAKNKTKTINIIEDVINFLDDKVADCITRNKKGISKLSKK